jgi:uncharacterized protein YbjT (DUF2867 family)
VGPLQIYRLGRFAVVEILVTGASGVLGRKVVKAGVARGHSIRRLSRAARDGWLEGNLSSGDGITEAVSGTSALIHCVTDPDDPESGDIAATRNLVTAALANGGVHVVYPGIVGSDVIPLKYYGAKIAVEEILLESGCPVTVQRYTQFHELVWFMLGRLTRYPVVPVPKDTRVQTLDSAAAADALLDAAERPAAGRIADLGGPTIYDVADLARSVAAALGRRRPIVRVNYPGLVWTAFRAGANLTENRDDRGRTWNEFVAERMDQS